MPDIIILVGFAFMCSVGYVFSKLCTCQNENEQTNNTSNDFIVISKADFDNLKQKILNNDKTAPPPDYNSVGETPKD